jgi:hypothetical protein
VANATEARSASTTTRPVYKKLLDSSTWDAKKGRIDRHPMLSFLRQGRKQKEVGWPRKEEAEAQNKTLNTTSEKFLRRPLEFSLRGF